MAKRSTAGARKAGAVLPLPDEVGLVLQGGGALGAYQAGVYQALALAGIEVDRITGISIGAVNAALIAGNPPERRVAALRTFWERAASVLPDVAIVVDPTMREWLHEWSAGVVAMTGVPGMFYPRIVPPFFALPGSVEALSFYDSSPLRQSLDELVDWTLLNEGPVRVAVGAVEVESGNFTYFDNATQPLDARHIMASGALPPGLPPVEIDGQLWWDGGLVSNTPLSWMLDIQDADMLIFQVDLFPAHAPRPRTISDVMAREKEIRFSSRTRMVSDQRIAERALAQRIQKVVDKLPEPLKSDPDVLALTADVHCEAVNLVHLIYRPNSWESQARDYEFSARALREHWQAGEAAVARTINQSALIAQNILDGVSATFDLGNRPDRGKADGA